MAPAFGEHPVLALRLGSRRADGAVVPSSAMVRRSVAS
ncbi:hypothetical protein B005_2541 [Nocardiopsis alba ATCC BAA-2165]|uniref:Uncharacterized protein n=1 Tax=Nocardiopsis alba (strain ATCC BAA-2165 / BE74) TaxID=1205910 RepID=J7L5M7_NOCAA|nr:hypothetical protein B005_2541 [Nocardiopsis alba ATCC BAA-2165]